MVPGVLVCGLGLGKWAGGGLTVEPLEHAIHRARAPAARHGDVEFVGVVACVGGDGGGVGHFRLCLVWFGWCWSFVVLEVVGGGWRCGGVYTYS